MDTGIVSRMKIKPINMGHMPICGHLLATTKPVSAPLQNKKTRLHKITHPQLERDWKPNGQNKTHTHIRANIIIE